MKNLSQCRHVVLALTVLAFASGVRADQPERQVTFILDENAAVLPLMTFSAPLESVQVNLSPLEMVLTQHNVVLMGKLFPDFSLDDTTAIAWSGETVRLTNYSRFWFAEVSDSNEVQPLIDALTPLNGVGFVGTGLLVQAPLADPNDPQFPEQWYLKNPNPNLGGVDINWLPAWEIDAGGNTKVGVYGGSILMNQPDLVSRVFEGHARDLSDHEMRIACIIGAATNTNPAVGMAGINGQARIYSAGFPNSFYQQDFINSMSEMRAAACKVVNYSYRWLFELKPDEHAATFAVRDLYMSNVLFVAAAGNGNTSPPYLPAKLKWAVAVGATNSGGYRWEDAVNGDGSNYGSELEVVAPGADIVSCSLSGPYNAQTGTSFAAPMYAGVASLLMAQEPTLTADDAMKLIRKTAYDKGAPGKDDYYGYGLIDAGAAMSKLVAPYQLTHLATIGGSSYANVECNGQLFFDVPGMQIGPHYGRRHEVRKAVTFPIPYETTPLVWTRTVGTIGWDAANPNYGEGYCEVVPNSISTTGCILKTYVYELDYPQDNWYPVPPAQTKFNYTVVGILNIPPSSVEVTYPSGGQTYHTGNVMQIRWQVTDNHLSFTRSNIYHIRDGQGGPTVTQIASNQVVDPVTGWGTYNWTIPTGPFGTSTTNLIRVTTDGVTDVSSAYFTIVFYSKYGDEPPPDPCDGVCPISGWNGPFVTDLLQNSPNPFTQDTRIRFSLDGTHSVTVRVFDVQGRLVKTALTATKPKGAYEMRWDGRDDAAQPLPSGVYFMAMRADQRTITRKVVIIR